MKMNPREFTRYIWRRSSWLSRIGEWARPEYCGKCTRFKKCKRYKINEKVIFAFARAKSKKTWKTYMSQLKPNEKCHDFVAILDYFMKPAIKKEII